MHSGGGSASQILTIPEGSDKVDWPKRFSFNMFIIVNNALIPEFSTTTNNTFAFMGRANSALIKAQTRSALLATYVYAQKTGIRFHVASIDRHAKAESGGPWKDRPSFSEP